MSDEQVTVERDGKTFDAATGAEIVPVVQPSAPALVMDYDNPEYLIRRAEEACGILRRMIEKNPDLVFVMRDWEDGKVKEKKALRAAAWKVAGTFCGVVAVVGSTEEVRDEGGKLVGYKASANIYDRARNVIIPTGSVSMCHFEEIGKKGKVNKRTVPNDVCAMAQTRAVSRALANVLAPVAYLGGWETTTAEDLEAAGVGRDEAEPETTASPAVDDAVATVSETNPRGQCYAIVKKSLGAKLEKRGIPAKVFWAWAGWAGQTNDVETFTLADWTWLAEWVVLADAYEDSLKDLIGEIRKLPKPKTDITPKPTKAEEPVAEPTPAANGYTVKNAVTGAEHLTEQGVAWAVTAGNGKLPATVARLETMFRENMETAKAFTVSCYGRIKSVGYKSAGKNLIDLARNAPATARDALVCLLADESVWNDERQGLSATLADVCKELGVPTV